jgi:excisionase family DNA binding protein
MTLLTRKEAAQYLRISTRTLDRLRAAKHLPTVRVRGLVRVRQQELDAFVARSTRN